MRLQGLPKALLAGAFALFSTTIFCGAATTVIDFESPLLGGLIPVPPIEGTLVPSQSLVSGNYSDLGVILPNAALVSLGTGIAPSGVNGIMPARPVFGDPGFEISSLFGMQLNFVSPSDPSMRAWVNFISITPVFLSDQHGTIRVVYYSPDGNLIDYKDLNPTSGTPIIISSAIGIRLFIIQPRSGSVAFDNLEFGPISVPEPTSLLLLIVGSSSPFLFKRFRGK